MTSRLLAIAIVAIVVVFAVSACGSSRDGDAVVANIGDLGHVHDIDLAASPDDVDSLLGIDADTGLLMLSDDGAQSWTVVTNAPVVRRVQWRSDKIVGVATDGTLYETSTLGGSWSVLAQVGEEPVAFTSRDSEYWIVADDAGVLHSDNGSDFRTVYSAPDRPGA